MGKLLEGLWDCPYCETKGIRGREKKCPICGKIRDNSTKFYLGDTRNYVSEEKSKHISKNPDWLCEYCNSYNAAEEIECGVCGHKRDSEDKDYFHHQRKNEESRISYENNNLEKAIKRESQYKERPTQLSKPKKNNNSFFKFGGITLAIITFISLMCFLFIPKEALMRVDDMTWNYNIEIQELRTVEESDWSLPSSGRLLYSQMEIHHYQDVLDHYETKTRTYTEQVLDHYETVVTGHRDLGNGYFEEITTEKPVYRNETRTETYEEPVYRKEPVMQTKYYYEIDKWMHDRSIKTNGHDKEPYWGEFTLENKEREGSRTTKYEMTGTIMDKKEKEYTFQISEQEWKTYNIGDEITVTINNLGMVEIVAE